MNQGRSREVAALVHFFVGLNDLFSPTGWRIAVVVRPHVALDLTPMRQLFVAAALAAGSALSLTGPLRLAHAQDESYKPEIATASPEAAQAARAFRVPPGMKLSLFAAEPMLANPVAFCIDERGKFYVCETFRLHAGVTDNRNHMNWLDADMACRTVDDRVKMYAKYLGKDGFAAYNVEHERVRLVEDRDGDGKADTATVFADGFKDAADGIGAGVLARKGDRLLHLHPRRLEASGHGQRRPRRCQEVDQFGLWRSRRVPRPRPPRSEDGSRRPALLLGRRSRPERHD